MLKILFIISLALCSPLSLASNSSTSTIIDLSQLMKMPQLLEKIADSRVIFVSETHTRYEHHLNQLQVIDSQHQRHANLAIGVEFIQQPFQAVLDDFIAGRIDEAAMLNGTEYFQRWSYDYRLYRPIFQYAREHGIPLIALNIDADIIDQVSSAGLDSLDAEQKAQLPQQIDRSNKAYRERLREFFNQHPDHEDRDFDSFVDIQLLWDESMAERAAAWLQDNPDGHMVILAGSGHISYGAGIPDRLQRRVPVSVSKVINLSEPSTIEPAMGDFVLMSAPRELPQAGKLGIILDTTQSPPGVIGFTRNSDASSAGLQEDDRILRIDDQAINNYADIRFALLDKPAGSRVRVEVKRDGFFSGEQQHEYDVELR